MTLAFKWINLLMICIFVLLIPIMLLFTNVQMVAFDRGYYEEQYKNYNISESMDIEMDELMASTDKLLLYLEGERNDIDFGAKFAGKQREFFSERDKLHMIDVKQLFDKGMLLRNIAAIYSFFFFLYLYKNYKNWKGKLAKYNIFIFLFGMIPILVLILLMNTDFNKYFTIFHEMFFNNDLWLLDPNQDTLINMFPEDFFADTAFRIGYFYVAQLIVILVSSLAYIVIGKYKARDKVGGL